MNIKDIHSVYFIGVGGIGMSALARYFVHLKKKVAGYDKTETALTKELSALGVDITYQDELSTIPDSFKDVKHTLVVYTPAIPKENKQLQYFQEQQFALKKRAEVLGLLTKDLNTLAVAGTHGKTTTSAILAHLLSTVNAPFTAFLGGISEDFDSNFVFQGNTHAVVEADEFDRSFLWLTPQVACITSVDADHLDIYGTAENLVTSFKEFSEKLDNQGTLIVKYGLPFNGITYGFEEEADYQITNVVMTNGTYVFDLKTPTTTIKDIQFSKPGEHNLLNAVAALAMGSASGFAIELLAKGLASFKE